MALQRALAETTYTSGRLTLTAGGDADVNTQEGRTTRVTLIADHIDVSGDGRSILVHVRYEVVEQSRNNTALRWDGIAELPIPVDAQRHSSSIQSVDVRDYNETWDVGGQRHDAVEVPNTAGTVIFGPGSTYSIDAQGDDETNARVELRLRVPIQYDDAA